MAVERDPAGRRFVAVEVDVAGTREQAWAAIATGAGVSSWFVDTHFEPSENGTPQRMRNDFGGGMVSESKITAWNPPLSFDSESRDLGEGAPSVHTTWSVEPRAAGGCTVRVEHGVQTDREDWDKHLAAWESGWPAFFHLLQLTLEHHRGEASASFQLSAAAGDAAAAWDTLAAGLGLVDVERGARFEAPPTAPPLAGTVERDVEPNEHVLRLDRPAPGVAHTFVMPLGDTSSVWLRCNHFGPRAAEHAERARAAWRSWLDRQFPSDDR